MAETRSGGTQYKKEMSDEDHEILLNQLLKHPVRFSYLDITQIYTIQCYVIGTILS